MSDRYTAYHLYQGIHFPEAEKARTYAYTGKDYGCAHSQRALQARFSQYAQRTHFDAANTTCCDEPAANMWNTPQYIKRDRPMNPTDCPRTGTKIYCTDPRLNVLSGDLVCATHSGASDVLILMECPEACSEFQQIVEGGELVGDNGTFYFYGWQSEPTLFLARYELDSATVESYYDNCTGTTTLRETLCGGLPVEIVLESSLAARCQCDCCGTYGEFTGPTMALNESIPATALWAATLDVGTIESNESCQGGTLTADWVGTYGASVTTWTSGPTYTSDGTTTRYITGNLTVGNYACCGGTLTVYNTDGCGDSDSEVFVIAGKSPTGVIAGTAPTATWANTATATASVSACPTGTLSLNDPPTTHVGWDTGDPEYDSVNGKWQGTLVYGSSTYPACCGQTAQLGGNDGCGNTSSNHDMNLAAKISGGGPSIYSPLSTIELAKPTGSYTVKANNACSYGSTAALALTYTCMSATVGSLTKIDGELQRSISYTKTQSNECNCCNAMTITADANDGCGNTDNQPWSSRTIPPASPSYNISAWCIRCVESGGWWVATAYLMACDGFIDETGARFEGTPMGGPSECTKSSRSACQSCLAGIDCGNSWVYARWHYGSPPYMSAKLAESGPTAECDRILWISNTADDCCDWKDKEAGDWCNGSSTTACPGDP